MSRTWFVSDTHFDHAKIIEYSKRPYASVDEMNEALVTNWNDKVDHDDTVWFLGDFAWSRPERARWFLDRLNGQMHVIRGNHDKVLDRELMRSRFSSYQDYKKIKVEGQDIVLFHYPIASWDGMHHGSWHLHGHCHGNLPDIGTTRIDVGVDVHNYAPISFEDVGGIMDRRIPVLVDHHGTR